MSEQAESTALRLLSSLEITHKEATHLLYSWHQLFSQRQADLDWVKGLDTRPDEAVVLEAFVSRYARLQDNIAGKLIPVWLEALSERPASQLENLNKAEKLGVINSVEDWLSARQVRNNLLHEYVVNPADMVDALQLAKVATRQFFDTYNAINAYVHNTHPGLVDRLPACIVFP